MNALHNISLKSLAFVLLLGFSLYGCGGEKKGEDSEGGDGENTEQNDGEANNGGSSSTMDKFGGDAIAGTYTCADEGCDAKLTFEHKDGEITGTMEMGGESYDIEEGKYDGMTYDMTFTANGVKYEGSPYTQNDVYHLTVTNTENDEKMTFKQ